MREIEKEYRHGYVEEMSASARAQPDRHRLALPATRGYLRSARLEQERFYECSVAADRYPQYLCGNMEIYQYQACMAEHGQQE